ncbi:MAG: hypothetical protein ACLFTH_04890 [Candidatus Woesearchaeota archaeon]
MTYKIDPQFVMVNWKEIVALLKKHPRKMKRRVKRAFTKLLKEYLSGTEIDRSGDVIMYRKEYAGFEIYYTVEPAAVVVLEVKMR